jgi:hypothetical protein
MTQGGLSRLTFWRNAGFRLSLRRAARSRIAVGLAIAHAGIFTAYVFARPSEPPPLPSLRDLPSVPCLDLPPGSACLDFREMWDQPLYLSGRYFSTMEDSVKLLFLLDLPAVLASALVFEAIDALPVLIAPLHASYLLAGTWLLFGSAEWWFVGIILAMRRDRAR